MAEIFGGLSAIVIIFLVVLAILWFLLPFAVFGIKKRLNESNRLSAALLRELKALRTGEAPEPAENPERKYSEDLIG